MQFTKIQQNPTKSKINIKKKYKNKYNKKIQKNHPNPPKSTKIHKIHQNPPNPPKSTKIHPKQAT
tara:strand:+ start:29 stop:223 length:195 start_codon:yes stop_codon:yes gene_type:complete